MSTVYNRATRGIDATATKDQLSYSSVAFFLLEGGKKTFVSYCVSGVVRSNMLDLF